MVSFCTTLQAFEQTQTLYLLNEIKHKLKCRFASLGPKYFGLLINLLMSDWKKFYAHWSGWQILVDFKFLSNPKIEQLELSAVNIYE